MEHNELLKFIAKAHRNTYAAPEEIQAMYKCKNSILPGHVDFDYVDGEWRYHDSFSGWRYPPGKEIVFYKGKPVWCMSYQGKICGNYSDNFILDTYTFLKNALMNFSNDAPYRGPKIYQKAQYVYQFTYKGDVTYLIGHEVIKYEGKEVFSQDIMASMIQ